MSVGRSDRALARRWLPMFTLVVAGEAIFVLPFVIARVFRPTLLDVFSITNLQLGAAFSLYGVVAMLAYFPGGVLADRWKARPLMACALWLTAAGGAVYATVPALPGLRLLFAFWGLSTILLFWAAMIRSTRLWGGARQQGMAFGLLDAGRGLFSALLATVTVALFGWMLPGDPGTASLAERTAALQLVIVVFSIVVALTGVWVWVAMPDLDPDETRFVRRSRWNAMKGVLSNRSVWLQAIIIVAAYTGYKGLDDVSLYAREVYGMDDVRAAGVTATMFWLRPVAALAAGLVGDRVGGSRAIAACFASMFVLYSIVALGWINPNATWTLFATVIPAAACVYGLRGLYFAVFGQAAVPAAWTGTAVGFVSVLGYAPDIFMGPWMGFLTDTLPSPLGHQLFFGSLAGVACVGCACSIAFGRRSDTPRTGPEGEKWRTQEESNP